MDASVLIVGKGEVGHPLAQVLGRTFEVVTKDVESLALDSVEVMHICYPFDLDFVRTTVSYTEEYKPRLTIVNSTVAPGTTRRIADRSGLTVVYSPVRGKHTRMAQDLLRYSKFVAAFHPDAVRQAEEHFQGAGMTVHTMRSPDALELAKLLETSYFGVLIGWAQEMERLAKQVGADYFEVQQFMEEIDFLPRVVFQPGFIGGHCVLPNSHLLDQVSPSVFMEAMRRSNDMKMRQWKEEGGSLEERATPLRYNAAEPYEP